jgi:hypothetical protein
VNYVDLWGLDVVNKTNHAIYVKYENKADNGMHGQLLAPGQTYKGNGSSNDQGRVDGVVAYNKRTGVTIRKVSDKDDSPLPPVGITVRQDDKGNYDFSSDPISSLANWIGDQTKRMNGSSDLSDTFYDSDIPGSTVKDWPGQAEKEFGDPSTWDQKASQGCKK